MMMTKNFLAIQVTCEALRQHVQKCPNIAVRQARGINDAK
eukprot:06508.XXX_271211_271330_1 [CDS] Oithona nana genome sequencing.